MFARILVPLDGSPLAEQALDTACELARLSGAELVLLRALQLPSYHFLTPGAFPVNMTDLVEAERASAQVYLDAVSERLTGQGFKVRTLCHLSKPAKAIVDTADSEAADLVVLTSHGRGRLGRWMYGSVAERVLRRCHKNVLLVRPHLEASEDTGG